MDIVNKMIELRLYLKDFPNSRLINDVISLNYTKNNDNRPNRYDRYGDSQQMLNYFGIASPTRFKVEMDIKMDNKKDFEYFQKRFRLDSSSFHNTELELVTKIEKNVVIDSDMYVALKRFRIESITTDLNHFIVRGSATDVYIRGCSSNIVPL